MNYKISISGSFRKHHNKINHVIAQFENANFDVLSPKKSSALNPNDEFIFLATDKSKIPNEIESNHLNAIKHSDILYLVNPDGYIGLSASLEIGWALANNIKIFAMVEPIDIVIKSFVTNVLNPNELIDKYNGKK